MSQVWILIVLGIFGDGIFEVAKGGGGGVAYNSRFYCVHSTLLCEMTSSFTNSIFRNHSLQVLRSFDSFGGRCLVGWNNDG
jgi:hypothetical protein